jgi:hypothetical protein
MAAAPLTKYSTWATVDDMWAGLLTPLAAAGSASGDAHDQLRDWDSQFNINDASDARIANTRFYLRMSLHFHQRVRPDPSLVEAQRRLELFISALPARVMCFIPPPPRPPSRWRQLLARSGWGGRCAETKRPFDHLQITLLVMPPPCDLCLAMMMCPERCPQGVDARGADGTPFVQIHQTGGGSGTDWATFYINLHRHIHAVQDARDAAPQVENELRLETQH